MTASTVIRLLSPQAPGASLRDAWLTRQGARRAVALAGPASRRSEGKHKAAIAAAAKGTECPPGEGKHKAAIAAAAKGTECPPGEGNDKPDRADLVGQRSGAHVALVTGASRGIGSAIARALAARGIAVAIGYHRQADAAGRLAEAITAGGGRAIAVAVAIEDRAAVRAALAETAGRLGSVDVLVNNAAMAQEKPFDRLTDADWETMLRVNLQGPFLCCQEALPAMLAAGWGRIVNITSIGGQWGGVNQVHYAAAKAGLINLTRSLARVYSGRGITCNAVSPGLVRTDMTAGELASPAGRRKVAQIPAGRIGTAGEVAAAVAFLATDDASYVTGQTLNVNGGQYFT